MPIYTFKCSRCPREFESIEKMGTKWVSCECGYAAPRKGVELPSPAILKAGVGGFYSPSFGERKYG